MRKLCSSLKGSCEESGHSQVLTSRKEEGQAWRHKAAHWRSHQQTTLKDKKYEIDPISIQLIKTFYNKRMTNIRSVTLFVYTFINLNTSMQKSYNALKVFDNHRIFHGANIHWPCNKLCQSLISELGDTYTTVQRSQANYTGGLND